MAQYFNQSWIDKVKDSCDIVDVISRYVPLKQKGRTFWGNCPFHHENEPSFAVSREKQFFNCFGCHVGGNVITFISKYESLSFIESVKLLANQNNIELPESIDDEQLLKNIALKKKILEINLKCAKFYNNILMSERGKPAREYLHNRGIKDNILTRFGLGYSPDWNSLVNFLKNEKISMNDAFNAGVVGKKNNQYYDFFGERLIFPIISSMGDVLGFSARVLTKEYQGGKYKNSPESLCFNKSNIVYGINLLKKANQQRKLDYAIICEGQMDVIALNQCGFDNCVASLGTAFTPMHAKEIKKFVDKVIVCFDGDGAGVKATHRSLEILEKAGLTVFVMTLPENYDPDEYIKKFGKENFVNLLNNSKPKNDYKFDSIVKRYDLSNNKEKSDFIKEILDFIDKLTTNADKEIYLKQVQALTKIPIEALKQDLIEGLKDIKIQDINIVKNTAYDDALTFVFSSYLHKKGYVNKIDFKVHNNVFYSMLINLLNEIKIIDDSIFDILENKFSDNNNIEILKNYNFDAINNCPKFYNDCIKFIKTEELEFEYKMLSDNISTIQDPNLRKENLIKLDKIFNEIQKIKAEE